MWSKSHNIIATMPILGQTLKQLLLQNQGFSDPEFWYVALWMLALQSLID